jgi:hypothetical protein
MTCRNWHSRNGFLVLTLLLVAGISRAENETEVVSVADELALAEPATPPPAARVQPAPRPAAEPSAPTYRRGLSSRVSDRLAAAPRMFGDFYYNVGGDVFVNNLFGVTAQSDLPLAAGCRRMKACENNMALPADRVYMTYNHFGGALRSEITDPAPASQTFSVDRYTLALEKTLLDGLWSVELRMPFASDMEFATPDFGVSGGRVGNLSILAKRLLLAGDCAALSAGLGIDVPTGSEALVDLPNLPVPYQVTLQNQAVHLMPFLALLGAPDDMLFYHGFLQVDVPTNGNPIEFESKLNSGTAGMLQDQLLLYVDFGAGMWLMRNPDARYLTGLAAMAEVHYTGTLQDADVVPAIGTRLEFGTLQNQVNVVNLTCGLQLNVTEQTVCRVGGAFPLTNQDNRVFDAELLLQLERKF